MTRKRKSFAGRPSLGALARSRIVRVRLTEAEYQEIVDQVAARVAGGEVTTVAGWIRDRCVPTREGAP